MIVIANAAGDKWLIEATTIEVKAIQSAVQGKAPEKVSIGDKLPAIDYAATIQAVKDLSDTANYKNLIYNANQMIKSVEGFEEAAKAAKSLTL